MAKDDNKKILEEIKKVAEQESPVKEVPKEKEQEEEVVIAKEDLDTLIAMAKKQDIAEMQEQETLGEQIKKEKMAESQEAEAVQTVEPQPSFGAKSIDYGGLLNRPTVLYFDTDRTCHLIQPKVNGDGSVRVGERTFDFSKGQPSILNMGKFARKQSHPFYIIKYSNMNPIDVAKEYPTSNPTPEQASRLVELGTLETLAKIPGAKMKRGVLILLMIMSIAMGAIAVYAMTMFGIL